MGHGFQGARGRQLLARSGVQLTVAHGCWAVGYCRSFLPLYVIPRAAQASARHAAFTSNAFASSPFISRMCAFVRRVASCSYNLDLLTTTWTTAREILVLPGGEFQQERDFGASGVACEQWPAVYVYVSA